MPESTPQAVLLMGATATGKTGLAVKLTQHFPVEIISVDSALIYKGMDIGTAKPDAATLEKAPHHLIDILDPAQSWSAWEFVQQSEQLIVEINKRGNLPVLVGGTMMYFHALEQGMNDLPESNEDVRNEINEQLREQGVESLHRHLADIDPHTAKRLQSNDRQRITRAIEVYRLSGLPMSRLMQNSRQTSDIEYHRIILDVVDRKELHQRIEQRFELMLEQGFQQEVTQFRSRGDLNLNMPSMRCVGYRQMWEYLEGNYQYQEMVNRSVIATRQLAKRQLTWLRKYQQATRFDYRDFPLENVYQLFKDIENRELINN